MHAGIEVFTSLNSGIKFYFIIKSRESNMSGEHEKLIKTSVCLEEEVLEALEEFAEQYSKDTGRKWSKGAVIRVALSEFCSRRGKIV